MPGGHPAIEPYEGDRLEIGESSGGVSVEGPAGRNA